MDRLGLGLHGLGKVGSGNWRVVGVAFLESRKALNDGQDFQGGAAPLGTPRPILRPLSRLFGVDKCFDAGFFVTRSDLTDFGPE